MNTRRAPRPHQALGLGGRSRPGASRRCATGDRAAYPQDDDAPADRRKVGCASPEARSAHRHPASFARSSTAVSGSAGASANGLRPASRRPKDPVSGRGGPPPIRRPPRPGFGGSGLQAARCGHPRRPGPRLRGPSARYLRRPLRGPSAGLAPDPLLAGSQPTLWGHASRGPRQGLARGGSAPLRSPEARAPAEPVRDG